MPDREEIERQQELLATHRRALAQYLVQQAALGMAYTPPGVAQGIHDARDQIRRIKGVLRSWRARVADHPDDEAPGDTTAEVATAAEDLDDVDLPPEDTAIGHDDAIPLAAGPPVMLPRHFFGRERELRRLFNLWKGHPLQSAAIIGQRRMGKTSLLNNLGRLLPSTIVPLFVDLQGLASQSSDHVGLLYNLARGMAESAQRQRGLALPPLPLTRCCASWPNKARV